MRAKLAVAICPNPLCYGTVGCSWAKAAGKIGGFEKVFRNNKFNSSKHIFGVLMTKIVTIKYKYMGDGEGINPTTKY